MGKIFSKKHPFSVYNKGMLSQKVSDVSIPFLFLSFIFVPDINIYASFQLLVFSQRWNTQNLQNVLFLKTLGFLNDNKEYNNQLFSTLLESRMEGRQQSPSRKPLSSGRGTGMPWTQDSKTYPQAIFAKTKHIFKIFT